MGDTVAVVVQPASGDVLQFLKAGIMEVPDVLVVTKADLGDAAEHSRRDLAQALSAIGSSRTRWSRSPRCRRRRDRRTRRSLDAHRGQLDLAERRLRSRRASALREFSAEHGERALRALGDGVRPSGPFRLERPRAERGPAGGEPRGGRMSPSPAPT